MKRLSVSEHELQVGIVAMIRAKYRKVLVYAVPNGGARFIREASRLKDEGVLAGVPDLALILPDGRAAFIEVKAPKGVLSNEQKVFRDWALSNDIPWAVARNIDDATAVLDHWLCGGPVRSFVATGEGARALPFFSSAEAERTPA
ncbi:VRR-NUC domain-containing protein [Alsobacter sp. R-9]